MTTLRGRFCIITPEKLKRERKNCPGSHRASKWGCESRKPVWMARVICPVPFHLVSLGCLPPCPQNGWGEGRRGGQGLLSPHTFFKCPWEAACSSPRAEERVPLMAVTAPGPTALIQTFRPSLTSLLSC